MKRTMASILFGFGAAAVLGQGTVWFSNYAGDVDAPVLFLASTNRVGGSNYVAQLYAGLTPTTLVPVGSPARFWSGIAAGYFDGGVITIPFVAHGGTVYCEVHAWDTTLGGTTTGATEAQAFDYSVLGHNYIWGSSAYGLTSYDPVRPPFPVVTGDPLATPPSLPGVLSGLQSFTLGVPVPEPSVWGLALGVQVILGARVWQRKWRQKS